MEVFQIAKITYTQRVWRSFHVTPSVLVQCRLQNYCYSVNYITFLNIQFFQKHKWQMFQNSWPNFDIKVNNEVKNKLLTLRVFVKLIFYSWGLLSLTIALNRYFSIQCMGWWVTCFAWTSFGIHIGSSHPNLVNL